MDILQKNKDKLIAFLGTFHTDRSGAFVGEPPKAFRMNCFSNHFFLHPDDEQFNDEKAFLIKQITDL